MNKALQDSTAVTGGIISSCSAIERTGQHDNTFVLFDWSSDLMVIAPVVARSFTFLYKCSPLGPS
ncbi:hypothetical protein M2444_005010 [Paenibacillus sp. PastF-3]|uniref:hypothetical protein n=1 Tax=Paenibacillus sp. PastF-3 TaxID=2940626 RepID=UPI000A6137B4|nr:hypothetical protein [Paenibacillus sp. PastF-3]MDH6373180.1 hypothetical protein [Paenibacillus sp. PastF-3]